MSASNSVAWRYIEEVTFGTTPGTSTWVELARTGGSLDGKTDTVTSKAVRSDRMVQGFYRTGQHAEGSMEFELAYGQFDDLLEAALCGTWSTAVALSGTTFGVGSSTTFLDSANGFITGGIQAGMWIKTAGYAAAANNGLFRVSVVTVGGGSITVDAKIDSTTGLFSLTPGLTIVAAGPAVTIKNAGMLRNGTTGRSFTIEQAHTDVNQFFQFRGMRLNDWSLNISAKALVTATFSWMGKSFTRTGATATAGTPAAVNSNDAFNTTEDIIGLNEGAASFTEYISSLTLSAKNNLSMIDAVGNLTPPDITYGVMDITGELNIYFSGNAGTFIDKYIAFTETEMSFVIRNGASPVYYIITLPAYKYSGGTPEAGALSGQSMCKLPFSCYKGDDDYQIQIDKISTT